MLGNILRKFSCQKLVCRKSFCKIQGMSEVSKVHAAWNITTLYKMPYVQGVKRNKNKQKRLNLRFKMFISHVGCCILHGTFRGISNVEGFERNKKYSNKYIRFHLFVM